MPVISEADLLDAVERAFSSSGHSAVLTSGDRDRSFDFLINGPFALNMAVRIYVKALTFAHRDDPDEYRIQLHESDLPLPLSPSGPTLLLGYYQPDQLFAAFDPESVPTGTTGWVSGGYMNLSILRNCRQNGLTFDRDRKGRISVGIRPNLMAAYALTASEIFLNTDVPGWLQLLQEATAVVGDPDHADHILEEDLRDVPVPRAKLIREIRSYARYSGFTDEVLKAYAYKCAVTGSQLGLVDAAHILPVAAPGSTDSVRNGIALSSSYHRAFDAGLIFLTEDFEMRINPAKVGQLRSANRLAGLKQFQERLGNINLPRSRRRWPDPAMIRRGNEFRKIQLA